MRPFRPRTPDNVAAMKLPALLATSLALAAGVALAEFEAPDPARPQSEAPVELEGTLAKVRASGTVTLAHRESSVPFSYLSTGGQPIGYSIELCRLLVEAMSETVGRGLEIKWLPVTSESRIDAIVSGRADLECGSTTDNLERKSQVAFSPTIFVSGTKLMVKAGSPIKSFRDLPGKTVVVTAGTTNEQAMRDLAKRFRLDFRLVVGATTPNRSPRWRRARPTPSPPTTCCSTASSPRKGREESTSSRGSSFHTIPTASCTARGMHSWRAS
jgi:glutamate/aspartate transport system substrate-binding protein